MGGKNSPESINRYMAKAYDRINILVPKGRKDTIKAHAEGRGESMSGFINRAIEQTMEQERPQEATGGPTAAPAGGGGILSPDTLKAAQRAAEATGETVPVFIARAVETQAQRDKASLSMGLNPTKKAPDKKSEA